VRIPEDKLQSVLFLVQDGVPRGSGFLLRQTLDYQGSPFDLIFAVTARHCIEESASQPFMLRISTGGDAFVEIESHAALWFLHDSADVALSLITEVPGVDAELWVEELWLLVSEQGTFPVDAFRIPGATAFTSKDYTQAGDKNIEEVKISLGNDVAMIGLLRGLPGEDVNLPVVTFGRVSRLPGEPVKLSGGATTFRAPVYLVEGSSWGGFSGSPCFWTFPITNMVPTDYQTESGETITVVTPVTAFGSPLLGVVSGHWPIPEQVRSDDGEEIGVVVNLNSGITLITPAHHISELLSRDDVIECKESYARDRKAKP